MPRIEWRDAYVTGITEPDCQHKELLELANSGCDAMRDAAGRSMKH